MHSALLNHTHRQRFWLPWTILISGFIVTLISPPSMAIPFNTGTSSRNITTAATTISATIPAPTAGHVMIVICSTKGSSTGISITSPTGFTTALTQTGAAPSQAIFYKISAGNETTINCSMGVSALASIQVLVYSGLVTPIAGVQVSSSAAGSNTAPYSVGNITTTAADSLLVGSYFSTGGNTGVTWSNGYTQLVNGGVNSGGGANRFAFGSASFVASTAGAYTTAATGGGNVAYRGQQISFPAYPPTLTAGIVDAAGAIVASPNVTFTSRVASFTCFSSNGTLGQSAQRIRVTNRTNSGNWSLSLAATGGPSALWTSGTDTYTHNNAAGGGCDSGSLSVDPSASTITSPVTGCTNTGLSRGLNGSFNGTSVTSITLLSATASTLNCTWDITNIGMTQIIPAETKSGTYTLNMTLTAVSS